MQKFWSILFGATMLGALLLFIVAFFVPGWWLPKDVSTFGHDIDVLFNLMHFWMHITNQVMFSLGKPFDARRHFMQLLQHCGLTR